MSTVQGPERKNLTPTQRNAESILTRVGDYLRIRFEHAGRINPMLREITDDLIYHELANVRRCLLGEKIFGPSRFAVADVLLSDDDKKRRAILSAADQTSIQVELVSHCQDDRVESTRGQIRIRDLKKYYGCINASLNDMIDLIETWIWWDLPDAAELVRFEQKLGLIAMLRQGRATPEMRKRYAALIHADEEAGAAEARAAAAAAAGTPAGVSDDEILRYEIKQILQIREQWAFRHTGEMGYKFVLKRDELPPPNQGEMVRRIAGKIRELDAVQAAGEAALTEDEQHRYAPDLRVPPEKVTREAIVQFLEGELLQLEKEMAMFADSEKDFGPPYNYKERQLEQIDRWLADLNQQLRAPAGAPASAS